MSIRVVIVDDEKPARDRLKRMLAEHTDFELSGEAADVSSAVELIDRERPDVCFLDVRMPGGEGFDVIRKSRHVPRIVFTTAYDQYAVRAFEVRSLDYLLKPFNRKRLAAAVERIRDAVRAEASPGDAFAHLVEQLRAGLPHVEALSEGWTAPPGPVERIPARKGTRILLLDPDDVLFFEAEETLVFARTATGRFLVDRTLVDLEARLATRFFRSHRSYLVNLGRISEILPEDAGTFRIVLKDEARPSVPLSRRQARRLRELIPW